MKKLNEKQQKDLRNKARRKLMELEAFAQDTESMQVVNDFKMKFNICESVYKVVLADHQKSKGKEDDERKLKLNMNQVPAALNYAGYSFEKGFLEKLFGGESKTVRPKTAKQLRDATTHGMNKNSVAEIVSRNAELTGYMDEFLNTIRDFDKE